MGFGAAGNGSLLLLTDRRGVFYLGSYTKNYMKIRLCREDLSLLSEQKRNRLFLRVKKETPLKKGEFASELRISAAGRPGEPFLFLTVASMFDVEFSLAPEPGVFLEYFGRVAERKTGVCLVLTCESGERLFCTAEGDCSLTGIGEVGEQGLRLHFHVGQARLLLVLSCRMEGETEAEAEKAWDSWEEAGLCGLLPHGARGNPSAAPCPAGRAISFCRGIAGSLLSAEGGFFCGEEPVPLLSMCGIFSFLASEPGWEEETAAFLAGLRRLFEKHGRLPVSCRADFSSPTFSETGLDFTGDGVIFSLTRALLSRGERFTPWMTALADAVLREDRERIKGALSALEEKECVSCPGQLRLSAEVVLSCLCAAECRLFMGAGDDGEDGEALSVKKLCRAALYGNGALYFRPEGLRPRLDPLFLTGLDALCAGLPEKGEGPLSEESVGWIRMALERLYPEDGESREALGPADWAALGPADWACLLEGVRGCPEKEAEALARVEEALAGLERSGGLESMGLEGAGSRGPGGEEREGLSLVELFRVADRLRRYLR